MHMYGLVVILVCFVAKNLTAESTPEPILESTTDDNNADLIFPQQRCYKTYYVDVYAKANWFKAQEICGYRGLKLASINSYAEDYALQIYLLNRNLSSNSEEFWLSGSKLSNGRDWIWLNSGRPIVFNRWAVGRPHGSRKCLAMQSNGQWTNDRCEKVKYFVCESSRESVPI